MKAKICLIFRDSSTGGKSIEEIFRGLLRHMSLMIGLSSYTYDKSRTLRINLKELNKMNSTVYHITGGVYFLAFFLRKKTIITIHDIGRFKELSGLKRFTYSLVYLRLPLLFSNQITTVSNYTKQDILYYFGKFLNRKITVIYNPVPTIFIQNEKQFNSTLPRILQVGTDKHKNIKTIIQSLMGIPCTLVIIGRLDDPTKDLVDSASINYENYAELSYPEIYQEYCRADIVVFASLHEGFGMPVIEAQATGRPVIATKIPAIEEIGGDGVHYINDPLNAEEIRVGIKKVISDKSYRDSLISKGILNISRFSIEEISSQYMTLYAKLLAS